jgi:hypothetical protein
MWRHVEANGTYRVGVRSRKRHRSDPRQHTGSAFDRTTMGSNGLVVRDRDKS